MIQLAKAYITETINRSFTVENISTMLEKASVEIGFDDFKSLGWHYLVLDEIHGHDTTIHVLGMFDTMTEAQSWFAELDRIIVSKDYMRRPETSNKRNKYDDEQKPLPEYILDERLWHECDGCYVKAHHRFCLVSVNKMYQK